MSPSELLRAALRALRAHKLRSFLTLLGVIIGVTTIVAVVGVISGLDTYVKERVIVLAPDVFILRKIGMPQSTEDFLKQIRRPNMSWREYERISSGILPHTAQVAVGVGKSMQVKSGSRHLDAINVLGVSTNFASLFKLEFEGGRFFTEAEDHAAANVAVIGADTKDELFPRVDPIGRTLQLGGLSFKVVGLMPRQGRGVGFNQDVMIYVPAQVYRKNFMVADEMLNFYIQARGGVAGLDQSVDEVRALLRAMRHTAYRDPDPFGVLTQEALQELWKQISSAAFVLMLLVSSVSLGVGGIVIMNIMLVSVVERTQEIGIRMALGARKRDIRWQFLLEAAILSLCGGLLGVLAGAIIAWMVRVVAGFPAQITPGIVLSSVVVATLVGVLAGLLPAIRAANLPLIDALRAE
jgi:putative ABC transport system permease protein